MEIPEEEGIATNYKIKDVSIKGFVTLQFNDNLDLLQMNEFTNASFVEFSVVKNK